MADTSETFTNEDHLSSHQKRHDMSLLLPGGITISRSNSLTLGADLTPTPTRFIRIGEEVGLFQDLLKANPFDEQFRKAAEQNKAASVTLPLPFSGACDEPLNTPHIVHPGEGGEHAVKPPITPSVETPQPRLVSPPQHRLGSPPPAHVVVTPCSPLRALGGAPPAHRDPLDPDGHVHIDDDMEVEGPLDMRSPSVLPPVPEPASVIHVPPASLAASLAVSAAHCGTGIDVTPSSHHTPTTLQSSAVSSTVATPRHQLLSVGAVPPLSRPPPVSVSAPPISVCSPASLYGISGLPGGLLTPGTAALLAGGDSPEPVSGAGPFCQLKLSDGQLLQALGVHSAASVPASAAHDHLQLSAASGGTVRERLKRTLKRQDRHPEPVSSPPIPQHQQQLTPPPSQDERQRNSSQSEDSLRKERNRAAANRWRARKKRAQQQMASSMEALNCRVTELQHENAQLRVQHAQLRLLLVQHRDCDVTRGLKQPAADTAGLSRLEVDELLRMLGADPGGTSAPPAAEPVRRSVPPPAASVPLVFSTAQPVPSLPVVSGGGGTTHQATHQATHQLILLQPAPGGGGGSGQRLAQYRLPPVSAAGRATLQPPAAHRDRL